MWEKNNDNIFWLIPTYSGSKKQSVNINPSPGTDNIVDVYKMIDSMGYLVLAHSW